VNLLIIIGLSNTYEKCASVRLIEILKHSDESSPSCMNYKGKNFRLLSFKKNIVFKYNYFYDF